MATGVVIEIPGGTREQYDALFERVMGVPVDQASNAEGGLVHIAGPMDGGWRIIDIWENREVAERFINERIAPAAQALGYPPGPPPQFFEVHGLLIRRQSQASPRPRLGLVWRGHDRWQRRGTPLDRVRLLRGGVPGPPPRDVRQ